MSGRDGPPPQELVARYGAAYGSGPDAARFLREVAERLRQAGTRRPHDGADRAGHWNDGLDGYGHSADPADCCGGS